MQRDLSSRQEIEAVPEPRRLSWRRHEVREQQTVAQIAALYKVRLAEVLAVNSVAPGGPQPGDRVTIPLPYRPEPVRSAARTHLLHYRVRPGDSLGSIARRYRVTVAQLEQWNHAAAGGQVQTGQVLSVRVASAGPVAKDKAAPAKSTHSKRRTAPASRAAAPKADATTVAQATSPSAN